jgi:hypothetical protein
MPDRKPIFRQEALERLSSPERLDQLVYVIRIQDRLFMATMLLIVAAGLYWSVVGRLPVTAYGQGIILQEPKLASGGTGEALICRTYFAVRDGKRIQPGMRIEVVPDTVKRERFGGIVGKVRTVSQIPVSRDAAAAALGNSDLAGRLLGEPPCIEVIVELERDSSTFSGLRWTSSHGPEMRVSPWTTTVGRVTLEERAPLSYVLPFVRSASGI